MHYSVQEKSITAKIVIKTIMYFPESISVMLTDYVKKM